MGNFKLKEGNNYKLIGIIYYIVSMNCYLDFLFLKVLFFIKNGSSLLFYMKDYYECSKYSCNYYYSFKSYCDEVMEL